jgi:hypothetical protein
LRDRAIIFLLVDTGLRASELCELRLRQVDLKSHRIVDMGKVRKERTLPIAPRTAQAMVRLARELCSRPLLRAAVRAGVVSPRRALAVLPVVNSLMFLFRSFGFSYMEAVIALAGERFQEYPAVRKFAVLMGLAVTFVVAVFISTGLARRWYEDVSGLSTDLAELKDLAADHPDKLKEMLALWDDYVRRNHVVLPNRSPFETLEDTLPQRVPVQAGYPPLNLKRQYVPPPDMVADPKP